jgi:hypothetical protein
MNYDTNKYRALGVGERIEDGDYFTEATWPNDGMLPCGSSIGSIVSQDDSITFLRPIAPAPAAIAKDTYSTGATRSASAGRGRFDLVPYEAMLSLARRYEMGAINFGDRNWERGQPLSRLLSSMRRHAHQIGYDYSEDHVGAVLWNAAAFVTMVERMRAGILPKELDDIGYFINEKAVNGGDK